jgi:hypothetical protein
MQDLDPEQLIGELRACFDDALTPERFERVLALASELAGRDAQRYAEQWRPYLRDLLKARAALHPLRVERASHWTFANHVKLIDPLALTIVGGGRLFGEADARWGLGLHRSLRIKDAGRWSKEELSHKDGAALAAHPALAGIEALDLEEQGLGEAGTHALFGAKNGLKLRALIIQGNVIYAGGAEAIAASAAVEGLEILVLNQARIGNAGARAIANSPHMRTLRTLILCECSIGHTGAAALASSPHLGALETLELSSNKDIGPGGITALAQSEALPSLRKLAIYNTGGKSKGGKALAASGLLGQLDELVISSSELGSTAMRAIIASPLLSEPLRKRLSPPAS